MLDAPGVTPCIRIRGVVRDVKRRVGQGVPGCIYCEQWPRLQPGLACASWAVRRRERQDLINAIYHFSWYSRCKWIGVIHLARAAMRSGITMCIRWLVIAQRGPRHQRRHNQLLQIVTMTTSAASNRASCPRLDSSDRAR